MTLRGLDSEFPVIRAAAYLNHAASSPLPHRSAEALRRYAADRERLVHLYQAGRQDYDCRALEAAPGSVSFAPTTTDGVSGMLNGIDWRPGDNVLVPAKPAWRPRSTARRSWSGPAGRRDSWSGVLLIRC